MGFRSLFRRGRGTNGAASVLAVLMAFSAPLPSWAQVNEDVEVQISFAKEIDRMWANMPTDSDSVDVTRAGQTQPDCANEALRKAKVAITESAIGPAALEALKITVKIGKEILKAYGIPYVGDAADLFTKFLDSDSPEDFVKKAGEWAAGKAAEWGLKKAGGATGTEYGKGLGEDYIPKKGASEAAKYAYKKLMESKPKMIERSWKDPNCGSIALLFKLRPPSKGRPGGLLFMATGNCNCKWPTNVSDDQKLGAWQVIAVAPLEAGKPVVTKNKVKITYSIGKGKYWVWARCGCPSGAPVTPPPEEEWGGVPEEGGGGVTETEPVKESVVDRICWPKCKELWELWKELERDADRAADRAARWEKLAAESKAKVDELDAKIAERKERLAPVQKRLDYYATKNLSKEDYQAVAGKDLASKTALEGQIAELEAQRNGAQAVAGRDAQDAADARAKAAAAKQAAQNAKDVYYRCAENCYDQALKAGEIKELPADIREWKESQGKRVGMAPKPSETRTKNALVGIVLPSDCRTGETVSGTVVTDPKNYEHVPALNVVEVQAPVTESAGGRGLLTGIVIDTDDGRTQRVDEGLTVTVPNDGTPIHVALRHDDQDTPFVERTVPVTSQQTTMETTGGGDTYTTQPVCVHGGTQVVHGHFGGDSQTTHIAIGGKHCTVIAETPRAAYWKIPDDTPSGNTTVTIDEGTHHAELPVCVVSLSMSAAKTKLMRGESTTFSVVISGLAGMPESAWRAGDPGDTVDMGEVRRLALAFRAPADGAPGVLLLTIENRSRDTISIGDAPGGVIALELGQGKFTNGKFTYNGVIHSEKTGGFQINGMVVAFLAVEGTHGTTDRGNGPMREDNTGKKGVAGQNKKEDTCPDGSQPGSFMLVDKVCRGGVWHWVRSEQWRCKDGTILSTAEIEDRPTKDPCVEVIP